MQYPKGCAYIRGRHGRGEIGSGERSQGRTSTALETGSNVALAAG